MSNFGASWINDEYEENRATTEIQFASSTASKHEQPPTYAPHTISKLNTICDRLTYEITHTDGRTYKTEHVSLGPWSNDAFVIHTNVSAKSIHLMGKLTLKFDRRQIAACDTTHLVRVSHKHHVRCDTRVGVLSGTRGTTPRIKLDRFDTLVILVNMKCIEALIDDS